jgi:type III pantothenate kinase
MTAFLAVTLGNTAARLTAAEGERIGEVFRVPAGRLEDLREAWEHAISDSEEEQVPVAVASVNPPALARLRELAAEWGGRTPEVAGDDFPVPIRADLDMPLQGVGCDRLLAALAAWKRVGTACIIVDIGTAITVNVVRADGVFAGGTIFPGPRLQARALAEGTALLPPVELPDEAPPVGRTTKDAIAGGILRGTAGAVTALVAAAREVVGPGAPVLLTGGGAPALAKRLARDCRDVLPSLVLEGLAIAYNEWLKR